MASLDKSIQEPDIATDSSENRRAARFGLDLTAPGVSKRGPVLASEVSCSLL